MYKSEHESVNKTILLCTFKNLRRIMKVLLYYISLLTFFMKLCLSGNAPIFSLQTCEGGCKNTGDCPINAACIPILGQSCGVCLCTVGYTASADKCVPVNSVGNVSGHSAAPNVVPSFTTGPPVDSVTITEGPAMTVSPPQWPPLQTFNVTSKPPLRTFNVTSKPSSTTEFSCETNTKCANNINLPQSDENPFLMKSTNINSTECNQIISLPVNCPNLVNGGQCVGGDCLNLSSTKSYCICPNNKLSPTCQEDKNGQCSSATGIPPKDSSAMVGKRFVHKRDPDYGAILARHYANSLKDCIRLCQWASAKQCRSVNYGPIEGRMVCELLTIMAKPETVLSSWLVDKSSWTYFCCFK